MNKKERELSVAEEWAKYYEKKGDVVTNSYAYEKKVDLDGYHPYIVIVNIEPHHQYRFEQFVKWD